MAAPTEKSYWWTTGTSGDGTNTFTQADLSNVARVLGSCHGDEGVGDYGDCYAATGSTGGEVVTIGTGTAIVDGKPHICTVGGDISVPAAVGAGNTRIDRIVLRASWAAYTVRLTRIAGTDAASPTAPAVTTTSGTTYDVLLYQVTVNTSGDVSISTDERAWAIAGMAGSGLKTNTTGGIDLDIRRQGGSATEWVTAGTTNYIPSGVIIQVGRATSNSIGLVTVTFPVAFSYTPVVVANPGNSAVMTSIVSVSATQCMLKSVEYDNSDAASENVHWLAIGPE